MLENIISEWISYINLYYKNRDRNYVPIILDNQLKNDMLEFVEANKALVQEQANSSITLQSHPQAYYTSRKLTEILVQEMSDCFECVIED
ncbi:unnamed protein product [Rhizophagus irregularis]|nr:unnamed protein product [Rhizophagus irregularis]CAB5356964.1 unnamed protein product [Rhizophagus irregularis]